MLGNKPLFHSGGVLVGVGGNDSNASLLGKSNLPLMIQV